MDAFNQTITQFKSLFDKMSSSQRLTLILLPLLVLGAFSFVLFDAGSSSYTPLSFGKIFTSEELSNAEQALMEKGLKDFQTKGRQILAPKDQVDLYDAALLEGGHLPTNWAEDLEDKYNKMGPFTSGKQRQGYYNVVLGKHLPRMLRAMASVKDADVFWTEPPRTSWRNKSHGTATVTIVPSNGYEVNQKFANVIRSAVANALSGIRPQDVVVIDQVSMKSFEPESESDLITSHLQREQGRVEEKLREKIEGGLDYIDGIRASVNVELDDILVNHERQQKIDPAGSAPIVEVSQTEEQSSSQPSSEPGVETNQSKSLKADSAKKSSSSFNNTRTQNLPSLTLSETTRAPGVIKSVKASVQIPQTYYEAVAVVNLKERGVPEGETDDEKKEYNLEKEKERKVVETNVIKDVTEHVGKTLGLVGEEVQNYVNVSSYVPVPREEISYSPPMTDKAFDMIRQWGGVAVLTVLAFFAFRMITKSMPKLEEGPEIDIQAMLNPPAAELPQLNVEEHDTHTREIKSDDHTREELQNTVRENPEMAAAVINQWLKSDS